MFSDKIYNPAAARPVASARTDTGLKLVQINHGSLTQEEEDEAGEAEELVSSRQSKQTIDTVPADTKIVQD